MIFIELLLLLTLASLIRCQITSTIEYNAVKALMASLNCTEEDCPLFEQADDCPEYLKCRNGQVVEFVLDGENVNGPISSHVQS
jgi:hypothetical protein